MNVGVRVIPGAKKREIRREGQDLVIKLVSRPLEGKANRELVECLAGAFSVKKSEVRIMSGEKGRKKVISLPVDQRTFEAVLEELS
jgi:uncharacterized protein